MKKYNLLKVLAITVFVAWLLTLFIPASYSDYSGNIVTDSVAAVGVWSLLSNLSISISYFNGIAIFLIAVACFYAVMNKLEVYKNFVSKVASMFENKSGLLVTITIIVFGVLACLVSDPIILIAFMPFIYQVMKALEIDKKVILASTIVATLIGGMCGIYNSTLFSLLSLEVNTLLLVKVILLVIGLAILIFFVAPRKSKAMGSKVKADKKVSQKSEDKKASVKKVSTKQSAKKSNETGKKVNKTVYAILTILFGTIGINKFYAGKIKAGILSILFCWTLIPTILSIAEFITVLTEKSDKEGKIPTTSSRRTNVLFGTSLVVFVLFTLGAIIPWESLFNTSIFSDFNSFLSGIKIGDYAIFNNIIAAPVVTDSTGYASGVINAFGNWTISDVAIFLLIITAVIALSSKIKFNDFIATATDGIKKVLPIAITAMLISIVLVIMVTSGVAVTIANFIVSLASGFNIATATLASMVGSVLTGDFYYFASTVGVVFTTVITNTDLYGVIGFIMQSIYYLMMIFAPTSVALIIGLYYLNIPFGKWFKYIWKVLLALFVVIIVAAIIIFALV